MPNLTEQFKHYGAIFGKDLVVQLAPKMTAGLINELFEQWHVDVDSITKDVENNRSLWTGLAEEPKQQLAHAIRQTGNLDFITVEFLVDSIKKQFPAVASLFLNWPEAKNWLQRQIEELKGGIQSVNIDSRDTRH